MSSYNMSSPRGGHNMHHRTAQTLCPPATRGRDIYTGLAKACLDTLIRPEGDSDGEDIVVSNVRYLASYNWIEARRPTIIVPGTLCMFRNLY